jgi:hypothetical protein
VAANVSTETSLSADKPTESPALWFFIILGLSTLVLGAISRELLLTVLLFTLPLVGVYLLLRIAVALERIADALES